MRYVGRDYYVGLLSAAAVHGAAHQQPMRFQVITSAPLRPATVGRVHIDFHVSRSVEWTPTLQVQTDTGYMRVSTAEVTAFDLVRFAGACGGVSNVATVLTELAEKLQADELRSVAATRPTPQIQRLGFLLDLIDRQGLADPLLRALTGRVRPVSLTGGPVTLTARPGANSAPAPEPPWRVVVDESVEVDA
jgi:predicted transcriptional regulator of viral defense system